MRSTLLFLLAGMTCSAQLTPGFMGIEYREMLLISVKATNDSAYASQFNEPTDFRMAYQSEPMGLDNQWTLWINNKKGVAALSIRGTTPNKDSWLENFYAAMIPASDTIQWGTGQNQKSIPYHLADHPRASVHAGWTLGMLMLAEDMLPRVKSLIENEGIENFYITGHSQGGAIAYLLTAHFHYLKESGVLPVNVHFKTYCSAAPKPGNLYFAYDYESYTQSGWAFNVINSADWVPEVPFSIQTLDDFNDINPFANIDDILAEQSLFDRIGLWWVIRKLDRPTREAQENFEEYLGEKTSETVAAKIEGLIMPDFVPSNNYVRTGRQIVLTPNDHYYQLLQSDSNEVFIHHGHKPYLYLLRVYSLERSYSETGLKLDTAYRVTKFLDSMGELHRFYRSSQTTLGFSSNGYAGGKDGCNSFGGEITVSDNEIIWEGGFNQTLLYCENTLDDEYQSTLMGIDSYRVKEHELILYKDGVPQIWLALD